MTAEAQAVPTTMARMSETQFPRSMAESTIFHVSSYPRRQADDDYWKHRTEIVLALDASIELAQSAPQRRDGGEYWKHLLDMIRLSYASSELTPTEPQLRFADEYWKRLMEKVWLYDGSSELTANSVSKPEVTSSSGKFSERIVEFLMISGGRNTGLREALSDLDDAVSEAHQEQFPIPSGLALMNARRLLMAMYKLSPQRFEVYPTPDGEVTIDAPGGRGRSVLLLCDSEGGALCLVNMLGRHRRARYSDTGSLPDGFIREALDELTQRDELTA